MHETWLYIYKKLEGFSKFPQCYDFLISVLSEINSFTAWFLAKKIHKNWNTFIVNTIVTNNFLHDCHGSSPSTPCLSKASPLPPTAQPISKPFGLASNPPGSLAYFLFSFTDSCMFLFSVISWYSQPPLFTFRSLTFDPDIGYTSLILDSVPD